jgi:hypothetical protein
VRLDDDPLAPHVASRVMHQIMRTMRAYAAEPTRENAVAFVSAVRTVWHTDQWMAAAHDPLVRDLTSLCEHLSDLLRRSERRH